MIGGWKDYWNRGYDAALPGGNWKIPARMMGGLRDYILDGVPAGGFLTAVLENKLVAAFSRADEDNFKNLPAYASFLYNEAPADSWGSPEKVAAWIKAGGYNGVMAAAAEKKEEAYKEDEHLDAEAVVRGIYAHDNSRTEG